MQTGSKTKAKTHTGEFPARGSDAVEILMNDHEVIKGLLSELVDATTAVVGCSGGVVGPRTPIVRRSGPRRT